MAQPFDISGRVAVVTGASSGLGERFALLLARSGSSVLAVARRGDMLASLAELHPGIVPHVADLSDDEQRAGVIPAALDRFGRIDIVVNNAGMGGSAAALDETLARFRQVVELDLVAVFDLARLAARPMIEAGGGTIVNVSSMLGSVAAAPFTDVAYCASKAGVDGLTRELACQRARSGVRVNSLAPGHFPSDMTVPLQEDERTASYLRRNSPMGRMGTDTELDGALLFLVSDASTYYTGQVLTVDGGWTAR